MNLDKIRGQAKHAAWYDDPDETPTFNPFRKVRTGLPSKKNSLRNAENGDSNLTRITTDQDHQHASALGRRTEMAGASGSKPRFSTAPVSDRSRTKPVKDEAGNPIEIDRTSSPEPEVLPFEKDTALPVEETKESTSSDTIAAEEINTDEKPRHRKGLKGLFHRKDKKADNEKIEQIDADKPPYTFGNQIRATLFNSWINVLLIAGKLWEQGHWRVLAD
jgi:Ca2+:H+ antiporter